MFLSYLALTILIIVVIAVVYLFVWIHDIPYRLAKSLGSGDSAALRHAIRDLPVRLDNLAKRALAGGNHD